MRELTFNETQEISGSGALAVFGAFMALEAIGCMTIGTKRALLAPISLAIGITATTMTTLMCIPVGFANAKDFPDGASKAFNYWLLGPKAGIAFQNQVS